MRNLLSLIIIIVGIVLLAGCGKPGSTLPAADAPGKPIVVGFVSPALTSTFHVTLIEAARKEGEKLGWKVESLAPDRETNFAAQVDMVQALVRRKVNAISICAINDSAIMGAVEQANAAGIPVFVHNSLMPLAGGKVEAYIGYDQQKAGRLCGEYAAELLKKKHGDYTGKVYLLLGIPGMHTTERSTGFLSAIGAHPAIEVVAKTPANWERQQAMNVAAAALKATPDIDLFFACSDAMAQGAAQAAREAGKSVFTIGIDGNPDTLKDIKDGVVTASCAVYPGEMGRITLETIRRRIEGQPIPPKVETPIQIIDQTNVDELLQP
ncbi:MAG TPA: sugar ABC transporter substrate-binding protein [Candidatus Hydrogenedentes bacterium]|nr:sugar ABC transporter substrate-binding protein [Candidatus Hydrogenedentota bacterium]HOV72839.1 sugar ABC transporter substrate-binding protein [Candidatus Hydrogenedentota bacterium]